MVHKIFAKYDVDRSGYLEKNEVLKLLDEILISQGRPQTSQSQFNRFFAEFDANGDGVISKGECYNFVNSFINQNQTRSRDPIEQLVHKIYAKYDRDRNGYLDKQEAIKFLDEILINQGRPKTTWNQFNNFFAKYDDNGDGVISKGECYNFVSNFLGAN